MSRYDQSRVASFLHDRVKDDGRYSGTFTFDIEVGPVPAHRHLNPDGVLGGWCADTTTIDPTCWVTKRGMVFDTAQVLGTSRVYGTVCGNRVVQDKDV